MPTDPDPEPELTTIHSLPAEMLTKLLLRVRTPVALVHAAAVSRSWRGAITATNPDFLADYRKRHNSSSPFLGLYVPCQFAGPPSFQMPNSIRLAPDDDRDLSDAALRAFYFGQIRGYQDHRLHADAACFILGRLPVHPDCRLLDCHNSRLLLTRGDEALEVRSPLARETILLPFPPHVDSLEAACLLQGHDDEPASFRVVFLQHRRLGRNRQARAVEYDSRRKSWQDHPWETHSIEGTPEALMHAGHRVFCIYKGLTSAALLLDTTSFNMQLSVLPLPTHQNFAIGEIEDNACCFVESDGGYTTNPRLRVWQLDEENLGWGLKKDVKMGQVLGEHVGFYRPRVISNGIALLSSRTTNHHFVVDLNTCSIKHKFEFQGQFAYPMQMPWPPAFSAPTTNNVMNPGSSEDGDNESQHQVISRDGAAPLNYMISNELQDLDIQEPTKTAPTPSAAEQQCFAKDKNGVPSDYLVYRRKKKNDYLLKGVDPWITSMTPQSQLEHSGTEQCYNDQSLCSSHKCVNIEKPVFPTDNDEVQQETMANLVSESETGNLQTDPSAPTSVLHQPRTSESRCYVPRQEDSTVGLGDRSSERSPIVEGNMSVGSVLASAGCDAHLQGSITEPFSQQDKHDHTATVEPKSCRQKFPNLPHFADGEVTDDSGSSNQSSKDSSPEGPSAHATVTPGFDRIRDVLPTDASEPGHLPDEQQIYKRHMMEFIAFYGVQPDAAKRLLDDHSNGSDMSKRNSIHQNEICDLAHRDDEPHQPRKKQKINARGNGYVRSSAPPVAVQDPAPGFDRIRDVLPTDASEPGHLPDEEQRDMMTILAFYGRHGHLIDPDMSKRNIIPAPRPKRACQPSTRVYGPCWNN